MVRSLARNAAPKVAFFASFAFFAFFALLLAGVPDGARAEDPMSAGGAFWPPTLATLATNATTSRLPLPFSKSSPPPTIHLFDYVHRYRTSDPDRLVLNFKKRDVSLESGARFLFSPAWFPARQVTFSYAFRVAKDFDFVLSGKLPGVYFGTCRDCYSTGKVYNRGQGSFRPTWQVKKTKKKTNKKTKRTTTTAYVEPYVYGAHGSYQASRDAQGPETSAAIGPGGTRAGFHLWPREDDSFDIRPGEWNTVAIHVRLNDPGRANGVARVTINGNARELRDVSFRDDERTLIQSVAMECFFGGSSRRHMTPRRKQRIEFRDVVVVGA